MPKPKQIMSNLKQIKSRIKQIVPRSEKKNHIKKVKIDKDKLFNRVFNVKSQSIIARVDEKDEKLVVKNKKMQGSSGKVENKKKYKIALGGLDIFKRDKMLKKKTIVPVNKEKGTILTSSKYDAAYANRTTNMIKAREAAIKKNNERKIANKQGGSIIKRISSLCKLDKGMEAIPEKPIEESSSKRDKIIVNKLKWVNGHKLNGNKMKGEIKVNCRSKHSGMI